MEILEGEEKEKEIESIFKTIMAGNFPKLGREVDINIYKPFPQKGGIHFN